MTRHIKLFDRLLGRMGLERRDPAVLPPNDTTDHFTREVVRLYSQGVGRGF